jgi:hypothetical protein
MKRLLIILLACIMAYAILGKIYTTIFYFSSRGFGLSDILTLHLPNVIILSIAMAGVYYLVSKRKLEVSLGGKTFLLMVIGYGLVFHSTTSFWDFFSKNPNSDELMKTYILGDIPNLILLIFMVMAIIRVLLKKSS